MAFAAARHMRSTTAVRETPMATGALASWSLGLSCVLSVSAVGQAPASASPPSAQIATTGEGEARITPDRATIYVGVQSRASTAVAAAADNARRQRAILDTLRALGLGSDQLSTVSYSVTPEVKYDSPGASRVIGYAVTNAIRAEARRLDDISHIVDAALAKGANQITSLQLYASKTEEARRAALGEAVARARADADAIARAAGGSIGPLIELTTSGVPVRPFEVSMRAVASGVSPPTPIEPGEQVVHATVSARWQFIPGR